MSNIQILGVYHFSKETEKMLKKYLPMVLYPDTPAGKKECWEQIESTVLIETMVTDPERILDIMDFGQPDSNQAAYLEVYLSPDSNKVLSRDDCPGVDNYRLAFYFHFYDSERPLKTSFGEVDCPSIREMPEELEELVPYEPPS